jgi:hypothetical protein
MFATIDDAMAACETAGLEPRIQHGGLGETSYWVCLSGAYYSYWSDQQFLGWANTYFALLEAGGLGEDDTDSDEDVFIVLSSAARGEV